MAKVLDYGREVGEFELQSYYYAQFKTNTLGTVLNPLFLLG